MLSLTNVYLIEKIFLKTKQVLVTSFAVVQSVRDYALKI